MARKRGSVVRRGKKWGARLYLDGSRLWLGTFDTEDEAGEAITQALKDQDAPTRETVGEFALRWATDYPRPKASTNETNRSNAKRVATITEPVEVRGRRHVLAWMLMRDVTPPIARAFVVAHPHLHPTLRTMFADAIRDGELGSGAANPFSDLRLPQSRGRADIEPLSAEEVGLLAGTALEVFADEDAPDFAPMMRGAVLMAAYTLIRPGELFALERDAVDAKRGILHVRRRAWKDDIDLPKNYKRRSIVLLDQARDGYLGIAPRPDVKPCPGCPSCQRIFSTKRGYMFTQGNWSWYWHQLRSAFEAKLSLERARQLREARPRKGPIEFYELRHTGASYMWDQGVAPDDIAFQLGHSDAELVRRLYGHPNEEQTRDRIRRQLGQNVRRLRAVEEEAANG